VSCLYLVRHAHSVWTPDEMRPLSQAGFDDARRVADILAPLPPEAIYSSPYRRAQQTVEPLAGAMGMSIQVVEDLRERTLSEIPVDDWRAALERSWDDFTFACPRGESSAVAQQRAVSVFKDLAGRHPQGAIVLATHGNLLALLMNHYDPSVGFDHWNALSSPDIYWVDVDVDVSTEVQFERMWSPAEC
jgi:2,3-bisphosphoglycerate-dependent phosphoglycerate mutase